MISDATISPCGKYRYMLRRVWDSKLPLVNFIMLNPSTADATDDDPTIRRLIGFCQAWGCGGFIVTNLFALRTPKPALLYRDATPVGPENDGYIIIAANTAQYVVAAWGAFGAHLYRDKEVARLLGRLPVFCIAQNQDGSPGHPLYLKKDLMPKPWRCDK